MTEIVNLNNCKLSRKNGMYGGAAGNKDGIIYNNESWLVKYPKNILGLERTGEASYSTSPLSEYIGSHIYEILGYDVHTTILGERHGKIVVACKDFATEDDLIEIRTIKNHANGELAELLEHNFSSTGTEHVVDIEELLLHLKNNPILIKVPGIEERFWEQAIIDIFINNNDRNNGNWGILRDRAGVDRLAPVFDNGGSFQTKISEEKIEKVLMDLDLVCKNASNTQTAYGTHGHIMSANKFLEQYKECEELQNAILKVIPNIQSKIGEIHKFIAQVPETYCSEENKNYLVCSQNRKELFSLQLQARLDNLLIPYYDKVSQIRHDNAKKAEEDPQKQTNGISSARHKCRR